ncbi:MAG: hypothetical protein JWO67_4887 [Streptosporangiaceae bacterium]|nr:hypothetical protein [Streptosporangiaceae bacterium]
MTILTINPVNTGGGESFETGYLDGELAAETGLSAHRATAIADMAEDHDPMYATGYYEGFWARHAVQTVLDQVLARDEITAFNNSKANHQAGASL